MPIFVNTGSSALGSVDIIMFYDPQSMEIVRSASGSHIVVTGIDWPGGIFQAVVDPPGVCRLGGNPAVRSAMRGSRVHLATVRMRGLRAGVTRLRGNVLTVAANDLSGSPIGESTPRPFGAGSVTVIVGGGRHQRSSGRKSLYRTGQVIPNPSTSHYVRTRRQVNVQAVKRCSGELPCLACPHGRERGDTNFDCIFDVRDVGFIQLYLAESATGFVTSQGVQLSRSLIATQIIAMDTDGSGGLPTISDARFLSRLNFNLLRFLTRPIIRPVQHMLSGGVVSVNVSIVGQGDLAKESDLTALFAILSTSAEEGVTMTSETEATGGESIEFGPRAVMSMMNRSGPYYGNMNFHTLSPDCSIINDADFAMLPILAQNCTLSC